MTAYLGTKVSLSPLYSLKHWRCLPGLDRADLETRDEVSSRTLEVQSSIDHMGAVETTLAIQGRSSLQGGLPLTQVSGIHLGGSTVSQGFTVAIHTLLSLSKPCGYPRIPPTL